MSQKQTGFPVKTLRTDLGLEFCNQELASELSKRGIIHQTTVRYSPAQNGSAERLNRTLLELVRPALREARLPMSFWAEAANTAAFVKNRCVSSVTGDKTPYELWFGYQPNAKFLRAFGCLCFAQIPKVERNELQTQADPSIFLGYGQFTKGYRVFNIRKQKVELVRTLSFWEEFRGSDFNVPNNEYDILDLVFPPQSVDNNGVIDEVKQETSNCDIAEKSIPSEEMPVLQAIPPNEVREISVSSPPVLNHNLPATKSAGYSNLPMQISHEVGQQEGRPRGDDPGIVGEDAPKPSPLQTMMEEAALTDSFVDEEELFPTQQLQRQQLLHQPMLTRSKAKELGINPNFSLLTAPRLEEQIATKANKANVKLPTMQVPRSLKEAFNSEDAEQWKAATDAEYAALMKAGTWTIEELPEGRKAIGHKWVFRIKRHTDGSLDKFKSRLVAKGFTQQEGQDYSLYRTYAPVAGVSVIRTLIGASVELGWQRHQYDVASAYINAPLSEEVFMTQPEGYVIPGKEHLVCRLRKSLYGLRQSAREWNDTFNAAMMKFGLKRTKADSCVYHVRLREGYAWLAVFIDDIFTFEQNTAVFEELQKILMCAFDMHYLGPLSSVLGIDFTPVGKGLLMHPENCARKLIKRFSLEDAKPAGMPLDPTKHLTSRGDTNAKSTRVPVMLDVKVYPYRSVIGALNYLTTCTRPDLAFAVNFLARFSSAPTVDHWEALKRVLRYLKGTIDWGILFLPTGKPFMAYTDANWGNLTGDRSVSGYCFS